MEAPLRLIGEAKQEEEGGGRGAQGTRELEVQTETERSRESSEPRGAFSFLEFWRALILKTGHGAKTAHGPSLEPTEGT